MNQRPQATLARAYNSLTTQLEAQLVGTFLGHIGTFLGPNFSYNRGK